MQYILDLQRTETGPTGGMRTCNPVSFASCSLCSVSFASVAVCLTV
ncbi:SapB/AmfS family lanthipeptide [Propionibacterium acidifaciens]